MPLITEQWLAGFFDGEGCINITVAGKHRRCILRLYVVNTDAEVLKAIQNEFGGQFSSRKHKRSDWKPFNCLTWTNTQAELLLARIGQYIVLKHKQLDLAMEFLALRRDPNRYEISSIAGMPREQRLFVRRLTKSVLDQEHNMKQAMHLLNKKGVAA